MTIYMALLRGINVNGQKMIKMEHLKNIFESLPFQNVKTYIQTGNVIFEAADDDLLSTLIESKLKDVLGYQVPVIVRTLDELEGIIRQTPFPLNEISENEKLYVSFLSKGPTAEAIEKLLSYKNDIDDFRVLNREVYILCRKGYGNTLYSNTFLEKKLGVTSTSRNWETINKIITIGKDLKNAH
ncbi:MAG: hypothetical protein JWM44_2637 [Bacilli bacterium]|nr:hypothetical protein [Bacilli bacterium]